MDITLTQQTDPAFDDIEQLEELYHSIIEPNLPKNAGEEDQESLDLSEESHMKTVLGLIVQKCFEKIKCYRSILDQQKKSVDDVQMSFDDLQEENTYLKGVQKELLTKIEQLKSCVDEVEETNENLQNEISDLKLAKMRIELLGNKSKPIELDSPQLNLQNPNPQEIAKPFQDEISKQEQEIMRLRDTMLVQGELIDKLETEVDRYHSIESKYNELKGELENVGQPSNMSKQINTKLSNLAERISNLRGSLNAGDQKASPGRDESGDESKNRNFVITKNLQLRTDMNRSQKRHKSLAEDVILTRMSEDSKENSSSAMNTEIKATFLLEKNSNFSLMKQKEKFRYGKQQIDDVDSDLDGQNSESAKSDKAEIARESLNKEKILLTWMEGYISNSDSRSDVSSSSMKFKKSNKKLPKSKFMREEELDTTTGATDRVGFKSSIDSYIEKKDMLPKEVENIINLVDQENNNHEICQSNQPLGKIDIDEYLRKEKKKARENTKFSFFSLIVGVVFGSRS